MQELKCGMYVRCPEDREYPADPRVFLLGQIIRIEDESDKAFVKFHDIHQLNQYYETIPKKDELYLDQIIHCPVLEGTEIIQQKHRGIVVARELKSNDDFFWYYVKFGHEGQKVVNLVCEKDILIPLNRANISPIIQLLNYEFQNPFWFKHRNVVRNSLHMLKNATYGFETLIGSRVFLMPHQIDAIVRAMTDNPCRLMLADEVGLGKTIEACVIMKGLKERRPLLRTLIIAPQSLIHQWQNELSYKFWIEAPIYSKSANYSDYLIFPLEEILGEDAKEILNVDWDLCIVDETHRLLALNEHYKAIYQLSCRTENLLLLSATPIQQRREEYLRLLSLLAPQRFGKMTANEFAGLLEKQGDIASTVQRLMQDIESYLDDHLAEEFIEELEQLGNQLNDKVFSGLISKIDPQSDDQGLEIVKLALAYLGENYQIERRIIRHRRAELRDKLPARALEKVEYDMAGSEYGFYERDVYEQIVSFLEQISAADPEQYILWAKRLLSSVGSSPWALRDVLCQRLTQLQSIDLVGFIPNEQELIQAIDQLCAQWQKAVEEELAGIGELLDDDPDQIRGRLGKVCNYLDETLESEKYVLFTNFTQTVLPLVGALRSRFGNDAVAAFHRGKTAKELQEEVDRFQNDPKCRFILCDELGGEGRNFQLAHAIIHIDLPWFPSELEQRIGRVDRIGRTKEVTSIVFYALETVEEQLFFLWDKGLNIFHESLSGLEIALKEILAQMDHALVNDVRYGLKEALEPLERQLGEMRDIVAKERYFDLCRQLDHRVEAQLGQLISHFDADEGQALANTMMQWTSAVGLGAREDRGTNIVKFIPKLFRMNATSNTLFRPPNMQEAFRRTDVDQEISGTFSRRVALEMENLLFFAPGETMFNAITENAQECYRGRCCAYAIELPIPREWWGLVFTWSVAFDTSPLIRNKVPLTYISLAQGYIPLEPMMTVHGLSIEDEGLVPDIDPVLLTREFGPKSVAHLGKRKAEKDFMQIKERFATSNSAWTKKQFPSDEWQSLVNEAYRKGLAQARQQLAELIELDVAQEDFSRRFYGMKGAALYYGENDGSTDERHNYMETVFQALQTGLRKTDVHLDSVALVCGVPAVE
ncbi:MAG TPA: SNF2-related protein [Desulfosporosinus sp.]|nr:SNF2-related protein [Desulfosporosinus sp.]